MTDLKTLKDLESEYIDCENACNYIFTELRAEAIKWVKEINESIIEPSVQDFIKDFFNLTEEDLK